MVGRLLGRVFGGGRVAKVRDQLAAGHALHAQGDAAGAVAQYSAAIDLLTGLDADHADLLAAAYLARAIVCRASRREEQLLADLTAAARWVEHVTDCGFDVYLLRANARILTGNLRGGDADYLRACYMRDVETPGLLPADVYRHEQAIADCGRALDWKPDLFSAYACRGWLRGLQGDWGGAARDYEVSLHEMPETPSGHLNILREKFLTWYHAAQDRVPEARLNKREWMAPGWAYCVIQRDADGLTRLELRGPDGDSASVDDRPVDALRAVFADDGWQYMASEYTHDVGVSLAEAHFYRRPV
jgi:tetratricopeptide (TPR) repeat protein